MPSRLISEETKLLRLNASATAGTGATNSTAVDMSLNGGWDGVRFFVDFETAAANNLLHGQHSANNSDWSDIAGSETNSLDTNDTCQRLDIFRPQARYVRCVATRGTSTVQGTIYAELYRARDAYLPTSAYNMTKLVEPAAGTK